MSQTIALNGSDWLFKGYIGEDWLWRSAHKAETRDVRGWNKGTVPGSVQHDLWKAGVIPDPYYEMNSLAIEWVPDRTWLYKKTFTVDESLRGQRAQLVFQGVDYAARYYLNGEELGASAGTYLPASFEVGDRLHYGQDNLLTVVIDPAPFEQPQIGYTSKVYTQKARMNYWWDFCPRMIHLGIWQDVFLRFSGPARIADVFVQPVLADDLSRATVTVRTEVDTTGAALEAVAVQVRVRRSGSDAVLLEETVEIPLNTPTAAPDLPTADVQLVIDNPDLWWPNGAGEQALYEAEVTLLVRSDESDTRHITFGIRKIEFVHNEGAGEDTLPYNLVVNRRKLYITGWNWVPADVLYGTVQPDQYDHLLRLAQRANANLLRVWGGGLIEREVFYDLCDRLGILVWQEFIQSSSGIDNVPSEDPNFIKFLVHNAEQAIMMRRNHPSLAVWCGGNELHHSQDRLCDESHPALAALRDTVRRLDPARHWVVTSPAGGVFGFKTLEGTEDHNETARRYQDVHGPWEYQGLRKQYTLYNTGQSLLHSEFGVEGLTNLNTLNATVSQDRLWPVSLNNPIWEHLGAWWVKEKVWTEAFGPFADLISAQRGTQFLQADGLRYALEADRRRAFRNGGTLPWQFNEPYPMASCTSAVDYFGQPKPVYYTVARAYRPLSLTARFATIAWGGESEFSAEVFCSNFGERLEGDLTARLVGLDGQTLHQEQQHVICEGNQSLLTIRQPLAQIPSPLFFLDLALTQNGQPVSENVVANRYLFTTETNLVPMLAQPSASVRAEVAKNGDRWQVRLRNEGQGAALWLWLQRDGEDLRAPGRIYFDDNYFCLLPGEERIVNVQWSSVVHGALRLIGWNIDDMVLK